MYWDELKSQHLTPLLSCTFITDPPRYIFGGPIDSSFNVNYCPSSCCKTCLAFHLIQEFCLYTAIYIHSSLIHHYAYPVSSVHPGRKDMIQSSVVAWMSRGGSWNIFQQIYHCTDTCVSALFWQCFQSQTQVHRWCSFSENLVLEGTHLGYQQQRFWARLVLHTWM